MASDWVTPPQSRMAVTNSGKRIAALELLDQAAAEDLDLVNRWRSSHSFPLNTVQSGLRRQASKISMGVPLVSQRLKRMTSIVRKLQRNSNRMQLARMQDIGGCRAVVRTVRQAYRLHGMVTEIGEGSRSRYAVRGSLVDYIDKPQASGYRGLHQVVRFEAHETAKSSAWNGLDIEIQIRSLLQHAWATSVEIVDLMRGTDLKAGGGDTEWRRFFALAATAIAFREKQPAVPDTPSTLEEVRSELRHLNNELRALRTLRQYTLTAQDVISNVGKGYFSGKSYLLIDLDQEASTYNVRQFRLAEAESANLAYANLEAEIAQSPKRDAVLVVAESLKSLTKAYPSYAGDAKSFVNFIEGVLWRSSEGS